MPRPTTCRTARLLVGALSIIASTAWSAAARAQEPPPPVEAAPPAGAPPPPVPMMAPPPAAQPMQQPPPPVVQARAAEPEAPASDLDVEVRRWAIGYAGISQVPLGLDQDPNTLQLTATDLTVPAISLRYWTSPTMAIEFGIGFNWTGGSIESGGSSVDKDSEYGFLVQGGLPLSLATYRHVSFQVIPYAAIGHGQTARGGGTFAGIPPADLSGTRIEIGARSGFELFFGFIGLPELALSATVGLRFDYRKYSQSSGGVVNSDTTLGFSTTVQNNPWDIFTGNVAARYYF